MQPVVPSSQSDRRIQLRLARFTPFATVIITVICIGVLAAWVIPSLGNAVPVEWIHMKANTAAFLLLSLGSFHLTSSRKPHFRIAGRCLAALVLLLALLTFLEYLGIPAWRLDTLIAPDAANEVPGRMSIQAAIGFVFLSLALMLLDLEHLIPGRITDIAVLLLCFYIFSFTGSLFFASEGSPGWALLNQVAPQTYICLALLIALIVLRRTRKGLFSILVDSGIGGKTARRAAPAAILLPFLIATLREAMIRSRLISLNYAIAVAPAMTAVLALTLVLLLARRNRDLEAALQEMSFRDELTGLYNRRGFNLLAHQAMAQTLRGNDPFSILFLDVDNLKHINDTRGHELGSEHLKRIAMILKQTFRESDILGRVGGDEFVVASRTSKPNMGQAVVRLQEAARKLASGNPSGYPLSFSFGIAESSADKGMNLKSLIDEADNRMYESKREKKQAGIITP